MGFDSARERCGLACLLVLGWSGVDAALVQAHASTWRVVVSLTSDRDRALMPRLRGQLSDVDVELVATDSDIDSAQPSLHEQLEAARGLARVQAADAVVWFGRQSADQSAWVLHMFAADSGKLTTRRVDAAASPSATASDALEAAALVTRSAVVALVRDTARGGSSLAASAVEDSSAMAVTPHLPGASSAPAAALVANVAMPGAGDDATTPPTPASRDVQPTPDPTSKSADNPASDATRAALATLDHQPAATARAASPATLRASSAAQVSAASAGHAEDQPAAAAAIDTGPSRPASAAAPDTTANALHAQIFAGAQSLLDGVSESGQRALALRAGCASRWFSVSLFGSVALGSGIADRFVDLQLARHSAGVALQIDRPLSASFRAAAGVHVGAAFFARTSSPKQGQIAVAETGRAFTAALALGPEASLVWLPGAFGVGLHLALDALPNAPHFALEAKNGPAPEGHAVWVLEPRVGLGVEARL